MGSTGRGVPWQGAVAGFLLTAALGSGQPAWGQMPGWLLPPRELLPQLLAGPRDPVTAARFLLAVDNPNRFGDGLEGDVAFGAAIPLLLVSGSSVRDAFVAGVEAGVFGRFTLQVNERDLISTDWVIAVPFLLHRGDHWFRLRYHHISGHLGDEYGQRFDVEAINYGRDGLDGLAYVRIAPILGLYSGASWAYNVHPNNAEAWAVRLGTEVGARDSGAFLLPYGAVDVEFLQDNGWDPRVTLQAGAWLPPLGGRRSMRVAVELLTGPAPQGQFHDRHTTYLTLGMLLDP